MCESGGTDRWVGDGHRSVRRRAQLLQLPAAGCLGCVALHAPAGGRWALAAGRLAVARKTDDMQDGSPGAHRVGNPRGRGSKSTLLRNKRLVAAFPRNLRHHLRPCYRRMALPPSQSLRSFPQACYLIHCPTLNFERRALAARSLLAPRSSPHLLTPPPTPSLLPLVLSPLYERPRPRPRPRPDTRTPGLQDFQDFQDSRTPGLPGDRHQASGNTSPNLPIS